jgi:hypothetical protein
MTLLKSGENSEAGRVCEGDRFRIPLVHSENSEMITKVSKVLKRAY